MFYGGLAQVRESRMVSGQHVIFALKCLLPDCLPASPAEPPRRLLCSCWHGCGSSSAKTPLVRERGRGTSLTSKGSPASPASPSATPPLPPSFSGDVAFTSYGAFWMSFSLFGILVSAECGPDLHGMLSLCAPRPVSAC